MGHVQFTIVVKIVELCNKRRTASFRVATVRFGWLLAVGVDGDIKSVLSNPQT